MPSASDLLLTWLKRVREAQFAHYDADRRLTAWHYWIGFPATILSSIVGTSVFASIGESVDLRAKILVGLTAVIAAVLTALQTFWRFSERADRHRKTAGAYAQVRREIEECLVCRNQISPEVVGEIRKKVDGIAAEAPAIPSKAWDAAIRSAGNKYFLGPEQGTGDGANRAV